MIVTPYHPATPALIPGLFAGMSRADMTELDILSRGAPASTVEQALAQSSYTFAYSIDDDVVVMGGLKLLGTPAIVWMLAATPLLHRYKKTFLSYSREEVKVMRHLAGDLALRAHVDRRWQKSVKWLHWLGFKEAGEFSVKARPGVILERAA